MKIGFLLLLVLLINLAIFCGLNYRQLYSVWAIQLETKRLTALAENASDVFQNPSPKRDLFDGELCSDFWKFTLINGNGRVSNEPAWHSAAMTCQDGLTISHFPDPAFDTEDTNLLQVPAAGQYNNVSLISEVAYHPKPTDDIVLKFSTRVSEDFYGTAGVIFQPVGTLQQDGVFTKPFDMFGFSIAGKESSVRGVNGALCYLALNWVPARVDPLQVDIHTLHEYEIRLRWVGKTEWLGIVKVDNTTMCEIPMPSFGPVEIHVWSDNFHVLNTPRRWWEIASAMDLKFLDGGDKQFHLETIQVSEEAR